MLQARSPLPYFTKYPDRYSFLHIKDFRRIYAADDIVWAKILGSQETEWVRARLVWPEFRRG